MSGRWTPPRRTLPWIRQEVRHRQMPAREEDIATLLQDYMWAQRPPLNANKLAQMLGVGRGTVANWMKPKARPVTNMLELIAEKTKIPLDRLYRAAGYAIPGEVWDYIIEHLEADPLMSDEVRDATIHHIRELQAKYESEHRDPLDGKLILIPEPKPQGGQASARNRKAR